MRINQEMKFIEIETARSSTRASSFRERKRVGFSMRERDRDEKEKERVLSKQQPKILGNRVSINYLLIDSRNERGCEVEDDE